MGREGEIARVSRDTFSLISTRDRGRQSSMTSLGQSRETDYRQWQIETVVLTGNSPLSRPKSTKGERRSRRSYLSRGNVSNTWLEKAPQKTLCISHSLVTCLSFRPCWGRCRLRRRLWRGLTGPSKVLDPVPDEVHPRVSHNASNSSSFLSRGFQFSSSPFSSWYLPYHVLAPCYWRGPRAVFRRVSGTTRLGGPFGPPVPSTDKETQPTVRRVL